MHYNYCPICGSKLVDKEAGDDGLVPFCSNCNKYFFDGFASCIIVLVYNEYNEIALLKQSYMSDKYLSLVSGYISVGETAEEAAIREVKEEIGITLDNLEYAKTYWFGKKELLMHGFLAKAKKTSLVLSKEIDDANWVEASKVKDYLFPMAPGNAAWALYQKYLEKNNIFKEKSF